MSDHLKRIGEIWRREPGLRKIAEEKSIRDILMVILGENSFISHFDAGFDGKWQREGV